MRERSAVGKITVIHGPMFSGKTEELLRRVRRAKIARKKVMLFKPAIDNRYHTTQVLPHFLAAASNEAVQVGEEANVISHPREILSLVAADTHIVAVEEAQFLDATLFDIIRRLTREGVDFILSLLDQDYRRLPFPIAGSTRNVGDYLAIAHESLKLSAICVICGGEAHHSQKLVLRAVGDDGLPHYEAASFFGEIVTVGTSQELAQSKLFAERKREFPENIYEARCRFCHVVKDEP